MKNRSGTTQFPILEINTWQKYLEFATGRKYKNWAFRG